MEKSKVIEKSIKQFIRIRTCVFIILLAVFCVAVYFGYVIFQISIHPNSDFSVTIAEGYTLAKTNNSTTEIYSNKYQSGVAVSANIIEIGTEKEFIFGQSIKNESSESRNGYFIINTQSHDVNLGLTKAEWNEKLKTHNIISPSMLPPYEWYKQLSLR